MRSYLTWKHLLETVVLHFVYVNILISVRDRYWFTSDRTDVPRTNFLIFFFSNMSFLELNAYRLCIMFNFLVKNYFYRTFDLNKHFRKQIDQKDGMTQGMTRPSCQAERKKEKARSPSEKKKNELKCYICKKIRDAVNIRHLKALLPFWETELGIPSNQFTSSE